MAYYQPQEKLEFQWGPNGWLLLTLTYQGRKWRRKVKPTGYVSVIEAAGLLQVSRAAVYQWIKGKRIPAKTVTRSGTKRPVAAIRLQHLLKFAERNGLEVVGRIG